MSTNALWRHAITIADGKEELDSERLEQGLRHCDCTRFCFQLERGDDEGKLHWQCRVQLSVRKRTTTLARALATALDLPVGLFTVRPEHDAAASALYCMKEDTRVAGPWADRPIYMGRDLTCMRDPLPWQREVIRMIKAEPDDRSIIWIYNASGNVGKSKLCKWLRWGELATRIGLGTATQIKTSAIEKGAHRCYIVDLPRVRGSDETQAALFSALEDIKNGWVESSMYGKSAELLMEPPHVVVFSNDMPKLSYASLDRWKVFTIDDVEGEGKVLRRYAVPPVPGLPAGP